jgi:hypothetical protein
MIVNGSTWANTPAHRLQGLICVFNEVLPNVRALNDHDDDNDDKDDDDDGGEACSLCAI